ncbi:hypothetical protein F511_01987 [Dorcoceras hygrometricum]|uniref:TCP domain-containing protein n=1 Tax=Dorcoceras hygrometricum TaxID=472368 RepID=A0A2Z7B0H8_9LAMI|nr:hypothetical protein F511_01987 [Dorcoceras hygrometricum]
MIRKENTTCDDHANIFKPSSSTSSKTWSRSNDPRIVRVSRTFGGKDRHSKVFTVKGLRDRRIRLSVPTAVLLYDLQERLGLNQPSKVVDWLLKAAKDDIDELPPLQIPPGSSCHNFHQILNSNSHQDFRSQHDKRALLTIGGGISWLNHDQLKNPRSNFLWGSSKDAGLGEARDNEPKQGNLHEEQGAYVPANNFLTGSNIGSSFLNIPAAVPYNSFLKWDPSNLTLSQYPPRNHTLSEDLHNLNLVQLPYSTLSVPFGSQQVLVYQPAGISHSSFPSHVSATDTEFAPKDQTFQDLQLSNSSNILQSQNSSRNERNKLDMEFHLQ